MHQQLFRSFLRMPLLARVLFMALFTILFFGLTIHLIEPQSFPTIFEGIWWAIITTSTVGYGDYTPQTLLGRIATIALILLGAGFLSTYFMTLATSAVKKQEDYMEGTVTYRGKKHVLIIGWNERSKEVIDLLCAEKHSSNIVLIDETLETNPCCSHKVHFIKGRASKDDILTKANVMEAAKVIITANQHKDELEADSGTILALLAVKGMNPSIYAIVEILTKEQLANAKRAGANEIIESNTLTSLMMIGSLSNEHLFPNTVHLLTELRLEPMSFSASSSANGRMFSEVQSHLGQQGKLVIGIQTTGGELLINPPPTTELSYQDILLVLH